ncbi:MAG: DUF4282 domain-containing protein [Pseudomonadota bacterium]|nr:DUF4282 domain-containing protein [Pseudomonadota bacterium]
MQGLVDFLNFRFFISPHVLVGCYYAGALGVPFGSWFLAIWIKRRYGLVSDAHQSGKTAFLAVTGKRNRLLFYVLVILIFICMEILWRVMLEFLIAYLQMREALLGLAAD